MKAHSNPNIPYAALWFALLPRSWPDREILQPWPGRLGDCQRPQLQSRRNNESERPTGGGGPTISDDAGPAGLDWLHTLTAAYALLAPHRRLMIAAVAVCRLSPIAVVGHCQQTTACYGAGLVVRVLVQGIAGTDEYRHASSTDHTAVLLVFLWSGWPCDRSRPRSTRRRSPDARLASYTRTEAPSRTDNVMEWFFCFLRRRWQ